MFEHERARTSSQANQLVSCLVFICILLVGCQKREHEVAESAPQAISVGGHNTQLGAVLNVALAEGFYKEEHLEARIRAVESSKQSMAALEAGDFDIVLGSLSAGSFNLVSQMDLLILADGSRVLPSIIIREDIDDEIPSLKDLKGRSVRTPREGSSSSYALARILQRSGLTLDAIIPKYLEEQESIAAMSAGDLDAAILNEPFATSAIETGVGVRFNINKIKEFFPAKGQQHMVIYAKRRSVESNLELYRRFLRAYTRGAELYERARQGSRPERDRVVKTISEFTGYEPTLIENTLWPYVDPSGIPDVAYIQEMYAYFLSRDLIDRKLNLSDVIFLDLLSE